MKKLIFILILSLLLNQSIINAVKNDTKLFDGVKLEFSNLEDRKKFAKKVNQSSNMNVEQVKDKFLTISFDVKLTKDQINELAKLASENVNGKVQVISYL